MTFDELVSAIELSVLKAWIKRQMIEPQSTPEGYRDLARRLMAVADYTEQSAAKWSKVAEALAEKGLKLDDFKALLRVELAAEGSIPVESAGVPVPGPRMPPKGRYRKSQQVRKPYLNPMDPDSPIYAFAKNYPLPTWAAALLNQGWEVDELHYKRLARACRQRGIELPWDPEDRHAELCQNELEKDQKRLERALARADRNSLF